MLHTECSNDAFGSHRVPPVLSAAFCCLSSPLLTLVLLLEGACSALCLVLVLAHDAMCSDTPAMSAQICSCSLLKHPSFPVSYQGAPAGGSSSLQDGEVLSGTNLWLFCREIITAAPAGSTQGCTDVLLLAKDLRYLRLLCFGRMHLSASASAVNTFL